MTAEIATDPQARTGVPLGQLATRDPAAGATAAWSFVRSSIEEAAARFVALLRSVDEGSARAVGRWSVAETAAHTLVACEFDGFAAGGRAPLVEFLDLADAILSAGVADVASLNEEALARETERRLGVLADRIESEVAALLAATADADGEERVAWLGGAPVSRTGVLAHLLFELNIHGRDIARSRGRPWPVPLAQAALIYDRFFNEYGVERFVVSSAKPVDVSFELHVDGSEPVRLTFIAGRLRPEVLDDGAADVRVTTDPATLLLVAFRRMSPLAALLRGRLRISGRRPWRGRHLSRLVRMP
jgi:hypothetical protein